jgi:hypothetical protein
MKSRGQSEADKAGKASNKRCPLREGEARSLQRGRTDRARREAGASELCAGTVDGTISHRHPLAAVTSLMASLAARQAAAPPPPKWSSGFRVTGVRLQ